MQEILDMLHAYDHYNVCNEIEIAKGKHYKAKTIKEGLKQLKRALKWQRKR